ncbi:MAG: hypothetical protein KF878_34840 [Planctomycetes bacterium]|nr:hypothetical protein [Planctomycetota bacterium]
MDHFEDQLLASSLHAFSAALAGHVTLPTVTVRKLFVALDGSDQDSTTRDAATHVAARTGAEVVERVGLATGHDIVREAAEAEAELIVMAAPFREDYRTTKDESLGSGADIVLCEAAVPVLLVREPMGQVGTCFKDVIIPISVSGTKTPLEAAWALALAGSAARVEILDVPDLSVIEEVKHLLGDAIDVSALKDEALKRAASRDCMPVLAAAREAGTSQGLTVELIVKVGQPLLVFDEATRDRHRFVVTSLPGAARGSPEFHRAHDLALRSRGPVLFV